jgi:hypothetical protein
MLDRTNDKLGTITQGLVLCPPPARIALSSKKPRRQRSNRESEAASSKRYRARFDVGQIVLSITALPGRAARMLVRRGIWLPSEAHTDAELELALSELIDNEGSE